MTDLETLTDLERRLENAEWVLKNSGFVRCDIPACNCNSWHHVGGFKARFDEIKEVVEEAGYSTNGRTLLDAVKIMSADAEKLREAVTTSDEDAKFLDQVASMLSRSDGDPPNSEGILALKLRAIAAAIRRETPRAVLT